jgi:hypothetical protein
MSKQSPAHIVSKIVALLSDMEQKIGEVEQLLQQLETSATTDRLREEVAGIDRQLEHALKATIQARF